MKNEKGGTAVSRGIHIGEIDGVLDDPALDIVGDLLDGHHGAVLFAFGSRGGEVGDADGVGSLDHVGVREVGDIAGDLAAFQRCDQVGVVEELAAREIDHAHAVLHLGEDGGVELPLGITGTIAVTASTTLNPASFNLFLTYAALLTTLST